ncbi:hypothetical protein [Ignicoccus hospitalis]|uniref:ABC-3 protein n=1 Tax=Ignicoccus hospitalis (strain KIN4/I / DSM 18386 / JCM 14125) TaxID=453591 RepID=A8AAZ1_IGNH4|nr:hypothetical protein [Ignicoccus hospitalis]ABU82093.1 hypothetical protein Igni_0913 [Ignicoccus hospitalis KIN4/I]HIH91051.1 hypothetical protein [Desulfurococcaceae archaeon]
MITEIAIATTILLATLPLPTALATFSLASLSGAIGCSVVCMDLVSPFLASVLLGFFLSIASFVLSIDVAHAFVLDVLVSSIIALVFAKKFVSSGLEEVSEAVATLLILASIGMAYASPEAAAQAMMSLSGSLWTVDELSSYFLAAIAITIMLVGSAFKLQLAAVMFDYEYLKVTAKRPLLWAWLLFFFMVLGTSFASFTVGLLSSQVLLILPATFSLRSGLREVERNFEATYASGALVGWLGCAISGEWGVPEVGVVGATFVLLIVSLSLSRRIGSLAYTLNGLRRGKPSRLPQQEGVQGGTVAEG